MKTIQQKVLCVKSINYLMSNEKKKTRNEQQIHMFGVCFSL